MITQEYLKRRLSYDFKTGLFTWLERPIPDFKNPCQGASWNTKNAGKDVGSLRDGYLRVTIDSRQYRVHRLAWLYIYGSFPKNQIDHKNGNRSDNRISNLRDVSHSDNGKNQKRKTTNKSGVTGVNWNKSSQKWQSTIVSNGKSVHLGLFVVFKDAVKSRKEAEKRFGFFKNHGASRP